MIYSEILISKNITIELCVHWNDCDSQYIRVNRAGLHTSFKPVHTRKKQELLVDNNIIKLRAALGYVYNEVMQFSWTFLPLPHSWVGVRIFSTFLLQRLTHLTVARVGFRLSIISDRRFQFLLSRLRLRQLFFVGHFSSRLEWVIVQPKPLYSRSCDLWSTFHTNSMYKMLILLICV